MPQAQQLGRYHLLDRIAFGGMAEIFRAKTFDGQGGVHLVAVKRVLAHLVEDQDFLQMLVDEAKISAILRHENIARLYEFARSGDEYFLAMEYVDGKDLRSLLERGRQTAAAIPPEHVAWIGMQTAHALHAAHTQRDGAGRALRIVHRDVSPSNVLCSYHGEVKLCDFGIAKATLTRVQTKTGVIKGKVKYMSPEQAMGRKLDHRSDLFSLGTVMYEMLTLQAPFQAPTEIELIFAVRDARKTPIRDHAPDVPDELARIIDKAMTRSRAARYQSGEDLALDLRIFLDRYVPGYRRSNFSRYMRKVFEPDIDRELRLLEDYEIARFDSARVGENLIADVLGDDAPFTRFTPMYQSSTALTRMGTQNYPHIEMAQPSDLHVQPTMMIDRASIGLPPAEHPPPPRASVSSTGADFSAIDSRVETGDKVELPAEPPPADLHAEPTRIKQQGDLHAEPTRIKQQGEPGDLHALQTKILQLPGAAGAPGSGPSLHDLQTAEKKLPQPHTVDGYRHLIREEAARAAPKASDSMLPTNPVGIAVLAQLAAPSAPVVDGDTDAIPKAAPAASSPSAPEASEEAADGIEEPSVSGVKAAGDSVDDEEHPGDLQVLDTKIVYNPLAEGAPTTPFEREGASPIETAPMPSLPPLVPAGPADPSESPVDEEQIEEASAAGEFGPGSSTTPSIPRMPEALPDPPAPGTVVAPPPLAPPPGPPPPFDDAGQTGEEAAALAEEVEEEEEIEPE